MPSPASPTCLLALLLLGSAWHACTAGSPPAFCNGLDCPRYTVVKTMTNDVELRAYEAGTWACTNVNEKSYDTAANRGFMRLFSYISGSNAAKAKVAMTAPVKIQVIPGAAFEVCFFVPFVYQGVAPQPSSSDVFLQEAEAASYYVLSYPGRTSGKQVSERAVQMEDALEAEGLIGGTNYDSESYFNAGYDSPWKMFNRHNEIWMKAIDEERR